MCVVIVIGVLFIRKLAAAVDSRAEPRYRSFCGPFNQQNHTFLEFLAPCAGASGLLLRPHLARPGTMLIKAISIWQRATPRPLEQNAAALFENEEVHVSAVKT